MVVAFAADYKFEMVHCMFQVFEAVDELVNGDRLFVGVNDKTDCIARDPEGQSLLSQPAHSVSLACTSLLVAVCAYLP